jgi:hypothetical protein
VDHLPVEDYKVLIGSDHKKSEEEAAVDDSVARFMKLYMDIFANQEFNIRIRELLLRYVRKCLKTFTDKRSAPYQDVKHFVMDKFPEWGFMKPKEVVEMFKTKRVRKPGA